ncbi:MULTISPECIES: DUF2190 family protein [unclassified Yoonia]|uniref:DUF2190 family protein n=1 Tax=unclassified Yoonia TaxID=2629118 RepID=UPI002B000DCA|nr:MULTISPECIES: capsid cement protein [unclassified Yoonia]
MKNYKGPGVNITVNAPTDVLSDDFIVIGSLFGFAITDAAEGDRVAITTSGLVETTVSATGGVAVGDVIYFDGIGLTTAADDGGEPAVANMRIGRSVTSAPAGVDALIELKLD